MPILGGLSALGSSASGLDGRLQPPPPAHRDVSIVAVAARACLWRLTLVQSIVCAHSPLLESGQPMSEQVGYAQTISASHVYSLHNQCL